LCIINILMGSLVMPYIHDGYENCQILIFSYNMLHVRNDAAYPTLFLFCITVSGRVDEFGMESATYSFAQAP